MFQELEVVTLTEEIPKEGIFDVPDYSPLRMPEYQKIGGLLPGDVGTIVHVHPRGEAFVVEFLMPYGYTVAIADVLGTQLRAATEDDFANYRFGAKSKAKYGCPRTN
jgi:hypothetical protein